jgi:soluble lytic murein transglycosylase|tara:strand:- start:15 stop:440 length:426 start_codon:yes stop_codon:yes gene_type:complete
MYGLIRQESHFNPYAVSSADAIGLAQLLPSTAKQVARWIGIKAPTRTSLLEPNLNIRLGTRYLASLLKSFRGSMVLSIASYNAGPDRIRRWMRRHGDRPLDEFVEEIPFDETRLYVKRVLAGYRGYLSTYRRATKSKVSKR